MNIREAVPGDADAVWKIFEQVVKTGDTFAFSPVTTRENFQYLWFSSVMSTFVSEESGVITGSYYIKPNQPGLGAHIANCGYMVHPEARGKGIGGYLCQHSLQIA